MRNSGLSRWFLVALVGLAVAAPTAWGQFNNPPRKKKEQPKKELEQYRDEADEVLGNISTGGKAGHSQSAEHWSIVIVAFTGDDRNERAAMGLVKAKTEAGLADAFVEQRDKATVIAYGRYDSADDAQAQADLQRIRGMQIDGSRPFAAALLSPPAPQHLAGSLPELDLRNAKKLFGENKAIYTLQVAIYGKLDRSPATGDEVREFRAAAEEAAVILRRDGELAFYYHAPERSMVTVGVFNESDYDPINRPGIESYPLMEARERHPLNLLNGQGIREKIIGAQGDGPETYRMQPSQLVGVPES